ncbi:MAG TPA: M48 family metallopeptidase [Mogibacterium sp.]|nr:M48 family metallopeptidase [Mogibacterium sp.]
MGKIIYLDGLSVEVTRKQIKRINLRLKEPDGRVLVSVPYLVTDGEIIKFVRSKRNWIDRGIVRIKEKAAAHPAPSTPAEKEHRRASLKRRIAERLPAIEQRTGLKCSGWKVRDMHTRWGSCNTETRRINLSLMLATRSDEELDYVILHELVHTLVPNHGDKFYELMYRFMPDWKRVRKKLRY